MAVIDDLIGIPFKDGGRNPSTGLDCWGLALEVYKRYGLTLPDYRISAMDAVKIGQQMTEESPAWIKVKPPLPVPCLVVIRLACASWANHVGVYIGDGKFIHAYRTAGICITRIYDPGWKNLILGYYVPRG